MFWSAPAIYCLPLVSVGLVTWALTELESQAPRAHGHSFIVSLLGTFGLVADLCVTGMTMGMAVNTRDGEKPRLRNAFGVLRYRGLLAMVRGLFGRYLGWGTVIFFAGMLVWLSWIFVATLFGRASHHSAGHSWLSITILTALMLLGMRAAMTPYSMALPLLALLQGSNEDLIRWSRHLVRGVFGTLAWLSLLEALPFALYLLIDSGLRHHQVATPVRLQVDLGRVLIVYSLASWFALLLLKLTQQRLQVVAETPSGPASAFAERLDGNKQAAADWNSRW